MKNSQVQTFGDLIRACRRKSKKSLQEVSAAINIDSSLLAKFERNERKPSREQIKLLSAFFKLKEGLLVKEYMSDIIAEKILNEKNGLEILQVAEKKIKYISTKTKNKHNDNRQLKTIQVGSEMLPELSVFEETSELLHKYQELLSLSGILDSKYKVEFWTSEASNKTLSYSTHGIFRYFGKFPPPIARHLIKEYTKEKELVLDPMCGSGTTALEALMLKRNFICNDINPLSLKVAKVKTTKISKDFLIEYFDKILKDIDNPNFKSKLSPNEIELVENWFLPETMSSIAKIKEAIQNIRSEKIQDFFEVALLSCIRKASKATSQQGRLFKDIESAVADVRPLFKKKCIEMMDAVSNLPDNKLNTSIVENRSILDLPYSKHKSKCKLIICHPPYFNLYKYSSINTLELSWMENVNRKEISKYELREFFKVGKPENVTKYLDDLELALRNIKSYLTSNGVLALMNGDTKIHGKYIPVNKMLIERLKDIFNVEKVAIRIPKFTEASWAASQRRDGQNVGVGLCDFVYILKLK